MHDAPDTFADRIEFGGLSRPYVESADRVRDLEAPDESEEKLALL